MQYDTRDPLFGTSLNKTLAQEPCWIACWVGPYVVCHVPPEL